MCVRVYVYCEERRGGGGGGGGRESERGRQSNRVLQFVL
jgi:hypothetical protein